MLNLPQETVTNEKGGKQSATAQRMDLLPMRALLHVAEILKRGAEKYGADNWRNIDTADHLNHALIHLAAYKLGDTTEDHAGNATCRILFFLDSLLTEKAEKAAAFKCILDTKKLTAPPKEVRHETHS